MKLLFLRPSLRLSTWRCSRGLFGGGNKEEKGDRKKKIWTEIDKGYFADLHEFRRNRGKRTEAPDHLCSAKESVIFPTLSGTSLSGHPLSLPPHGLIALILVSMRGLGMDMCGQYRAPFEREFAGKVSVYEVSLLDKTVFRLIQRWVERNLRAKIEARRQSSFLVCSESVECVRSELAIGNSIVGHAYLVDGRGRVRWRAHGSPNEREIRSLIRCTQELVSSSDNR